MSKLIAWLKSLYTKPAAPADQETKETEMTDQVVDTATAQTVTAQGDATAANAATQAATTAAAATAATATTSTATAADSSTAASVATAVTTSPLEEAKAKFDAFVAFVEHGIEVLGKEVEAELVALKDKYL